MKRLLFASTRENAGKTSLIIGISGAINKNCGYLKPLGDRLIYVDKKNIDYDSSILKKILALEAEPENLSLGFSYGKIKSNYGDGKALTEGINKIMRNADGKDILFIEGGRDFVYGSSINLDSISLAGYIEDSRLIFVISGNDDTIMDDVIFINDYIHKKKRIVEGVIINKVHDTANFKKNYRETIEGLGIKILGIVPFKDDLTHLTMRYISEKLSAKVVAGDKGLGNVVENILVGAMSAGEILNHILFNRLHKLLITSGDRTDMILTAFESDTSGIVLSNQLLPPAKIISMADDKKIPILLAKGDTFHVAKQIDDMEPLQTFENKNNLRLLIQLAEENIDFNGLMG